MKQRVCHLLKENNGKNDTQNEIHTSLIYIYKQRIFFTVSIKRTQWKRLIHLSIYMKAKIID
jgi:hypothetical protein